MTHPSPQDMQALLRTATITDLDRLAQSFASIGDSARADDEHGPRWSRWADWCWRQGRRALPADGATGADFIADEIGALDSARDAEELLCVLDQVARRHETAGYPNPFATSQPIPTDDDLGVALLGEALDQWVDRGRPAPFEDAR